MRKAGKRRSSLTCRPNFFLRTYRQGVPSLARVLVSSSSCFLLVSFFAAFGLRYDLVSEGRVMVPGSKSVGVNVCCYCGSIRPEDPEPYCAHGRTAKVQGEARQAAAQLWIAFQAVDARRMAFAEALAEDVKAGRVKVEEFPLVRSPGENVVFLQDRGVLAPRTQVG